MNLISVAQMISLNDLVIALVIIIAEVVLSFIRAFNFLASISHIIDLRVVQYLFDLILIEIRPQMLDGLLRC